MMLSDRSPSMSDSRYSAMWALCVAREPVEKRAATGMWRTKLSSIRSVVDAMLMKPRAVPICKAWATAEHGGGGVGANR